MARLHRSLALPLALALLVLLPGLQTAQDGSGAERQGPPPAPVELETVEEREIEPSATVLGTTEAKRRSLVAAAIEGYVVQYPIDEGRWVEAGDVLARLRDDILQLQLREARAALDEIRERHQKARRDLERSQQLIEKDAVTEKALDEAVTLEKTLSLQVPQAVVRVEILEADIEKKKVRAPFDGQVVEEHSEVGEWVTRGGPVASLVDLSSVFIRVNVPERYIRFIAEGQEVAVEVPAASEKPYVGRVASVSGEGDPAARTFPVRVEVANDGELRAGMSGRVELPAGKSRRGLTVPKDAILLEGSRSYVFVFTSQGLAERREVETGAASGARVEVARGLTEGERVVVRGNERIQPGMPLRELARVGGEPSEEQP